MKNIIKTVFLLGQLLVCGLLASCSHSMIQDTVIENENENKDLAFGKDRQAILAMVGDYDVDFSFRETVSLIEGYQLKEPKLMRGQEIVRIISDTGSKISLQHVLVVNAGKPIAIKHWRQDWVYEPKSLFKFVGNNSWLGHEVSKSQRSEKWGQLVYQVDDSPRYAGIGIWEHRHGISVWTSNPSWRPLPRRDLDNSDKYDVIVGVNRHAITASGWLHEQDNTKLKLGEDTRYVVREVGLNLYSRRSVLISDIGEKYIKATDDYWGIVRNKWSDLQKQNQSVSLTAKGEPEQLYGHLLDLAEKVINGSIKTDVAGQKALAFIDANISVVGMQY